MQDWGNFFDQGPQTESQLPVAAMRAAVRPATTGGPFGKSVAFPTPRQMMPSALVQGPPSRPMELLPMPEMPKPLQQGNDMGDMAKSLAGIIDPESQKEKKGDEFGDRMKMIDEQLAQMAEERKKIAEAVAAAGPGGAQQQQKQPTYGGTGAGSNSAGPEGFNNNVGNIRMSNINWAGKGQPHNGFETFATPQAGASAMFNNLASYASGNPQMTVAGAISKWAPPSENNTNAYIQHVATSAGIDPNTPLSTVLSDPDAAAKVMLAMAKMEKGGGLNPAFTVDLFRTVAGGKPPEAKPAGYAEGGRVRYLRSLVGT